MRDYLGAAPPWAGPIQHQGESILGSFTGFWIAYGAGILGLILEVFVKRIKTFMARSGRGSREKREVLNSESLDNKYEGCSFARTAPFRIARDPLYEDIIRTFSLRQDLVGGRTSSLS